MTRGNLATLIWVAVIVGFFYWLRSYSVPVAPNIFISLMAGAGVNQIVRMALRLPRT